jgi:hypothetical protein
VPVRVRLEGPEIVAEPGADDADAAEESDD